MVSICANLRRLFKMLLAKASVNAVEGMKAEI